MMFVNQHRKDKIVDSVDLNNFGVLFHDTKAIEEFQKRSGMEGAYTTEYQHHYINLVGRLRADGQILDIAIPLCMFNYHQEVSGAHVEFNLGEVSQANNEAMQTAIKKFEEFEQTKMYKDLCAMGISDWTISGMNSVHAHPSGVDRFSGTDLRANIDHPGVNFPLSTGEDIANFASIIQHKNNFAELIHTEYRLFNGVEGGERHYKKGRTVTIVRGYETPEPQAPEIVQPGIIDQMFGTERPQPPKPAPQKKRPDYILKDMFQSADQGRFKETVDEMMNMWKECEFQIDVSLVLKTNVVVGIGRLQKKTTTFPGWGGSRQTEKKHTNSLLKAAKSLFEDEDERDEIKPKDPKQGVSLDEMIEYLETKDYSKRAMENWSIQEIVDTYKVELFDEQQDEDAGIVSLPSTEEMVKILTDLQVAPAFALQSMPDEDLIDLYLENCSGDEEDDTQAVIAEIRGEIISMLVSDRIISKEKLEAMPDDALIKYAEEVYGDSIMGEIQTGGK